MIQQGGNARKHAFLHGRLQLLSYQRYHWRSFLRYVCSLNLPYSSHLLCSSNATRFFTFFSRLIFSGLRGPAKTFVLFSWVDLPRFCGAGHARTQTFKLLNFRLTSLNRPMPIFSSSTFVMYVALWNNPPADLTSPCSFALRRDARRWFGSAAYDAVKNVLQTGKLGLLHVDDIACSSRIKIYSPYQSCDREVLCLGPRMAPNIAHNT